MLCLVTYDVNEPHHAAVKRQCISAGFRNYVKSPDGISDIQLPNTTLIVEAENAMDAVNKFRAQVSSITTTGSLLYPTSHPIKIERVIGIEYTKHFAQGGSPPRSR